MSTQISNAATSEVNGTLRDCTPSGKGRRKLRAGDIAVIDSPDISRREAEALIAARPAAVVNAARFSTGAVPNYGPLMLLDADIALFENAGPELRAGFRDGAKKGRIDAEGAVFNGTKTLGKVTPVKRDAAEASFQDSQRSLVDQMEAYFGNTIEFIHSEASLLIDGLGIPDAGDELAGRKVLVVSDGPDHANELRGLRNFIREYDPALIAVGAAADTLVSLGYRPAFIVGDPADVDSETLRGGARVILPADPDGHAVGLERIQDLGIGAMTFPAAIESPTELALLLAGHHDAELVVVAGAPFDLDSVFSQRPNAGPATLLTRSKLGGRLVEASAITKLYNLSPSSSLAWLWAVLGVLVALAVIVVVVGYAGDGSFAQNLIDTWNSIALKFQSLFR